MQSPNEKIISSIKTSIDYIKTFYNIDIENINENNILEYQNSYISYVYNVENYYKFEKMFKYFTKIVKYYYRFNRKNDNTYINYSYCIYLFYLIESVFLKKILGSSDDDKLKLSLIIKIENIKHELYNIPNLYGIINNSIIEIYNKFNTKEYFNSNIKYIYPSYYDFITKNTVNKQFINKNLFIDPINKMFRDCSKLKSYECNEECELDSNYFSISYWTSKEVKCKQKNIPMNELFKKSSINLSRDDIINFICSYEQYCDENIFFKLEFDENVYTNEKLLSILNKLFMQGLNQKYPLENQYIVFNKSKLSIKDIIKLSYFFYDFIYNTDLSYFELYNYFDKILSKYTADGAKLEKDIKSNIFYIILYNFEYRNIELNKIVNYLNLDVNKLTSYDISLYKKYISYTIPIKLSQYVRLDYYNYDKYPIELLSGQDKYLDEYKYFITMDLYENNFDYELYKSYSLPIYFSNKNININFEKAIYKYKNLNYSDIMFLANENIIDKNKKYTFKYSFEHSSIKSIIRGYFKEPNIDISISHIPIVIKIDNQYVVIKNEKIFFESIFLGNKKITVKYIEDYEKYTDESGSQLGLNLELIESFYIYPRLMSILFLSYKNATILPQKKYTKIILVTEFNEQLNKNIENILDKKNIKKVNIIQLDKFDEKYITDSFFIFDKNIEHNLLINRYNYVIIKNENINNIIYDLDKIELNINEDSQLCLLLMKYINLNSFNYNIYENSIFKHLHRYSEYYFETNQIIFTIFFFMGFNIMFILPLLFLFSKNKAGFITSNIFLYMNSLVFGRSLSILISILINYIFKYNLDTIKDFGTYELILKNFKKENADNFLSNNINKLYIEYLDHPKKNLKYITFDTVELFDFEELDKDVFLYNGSDKNTVYMFSIFHKKEFVLKISKNDNTSFYITLINNNKQMFSECAKFYIDNLNLVLPISSLSKKCIQNVYTKEWIIDMIKQFSINLYLFFIIKFDNCDFLNYNSKNYESITYLINNGFELAYNPLDLLNIIGDFDIKSILDKNDIKYSESLIKNGTVMFSNYYNSMKSIVMMKYIFQEFKNDFYDKNKNISSMYNCSELLSIYPTYIIRYAKNHKSKILKSSSENDIIDFILFILTYVVDNQNILFNSDIINNFSKNILKNVEKKISESKNKAVKMVNYDSYKNDIEFYEDYINSKENK